MPGTTTRIAKASVKSDFSKMRKLSALRKGVVVFVATVLGYVFVDPATATHMAIAAMLVGLLDRNGSVRQIWHTMAIGSVMLALMTLIASIWSDHDLSLILIMGLLAFAGGVSTGVNPRAPTVFIYSALITASAIIAPVPHNKMWISAICVLLAGAAQALATALSAPIIGYMPERKALADAMNVIGDQFIGLSMDPEAAIVNQSRATSALAQAEAKMAETDIAPDVRRRYSSILSTVDLLNREVRGQIARYKSGTSYSDDEYTLGVFKQTGIALKAAAKAEITRHPQQELKELDAALDQVELLDPHTNTGTSHLITNTLKDLPSQIRANADDPQIYRAHRTRSHSLKRRILASMSWRSVPLKHGSRMAIAAVLGMLLAQLAGLPQGSWVAVTLIMVLRPDNGPTTTRAFSRSVGNIIGVLIVIGLTWVTGPNATAIIVAIGVASLALYALATINYIWQTMFTSTVAILAMTLGGSDPTQLTVYRLTDVLLGCALGLIFAFSFPIWTRESLPQEAATYCKKIAKWMNTLSKASSLEPDSREELLDKALRRSRKVRASRESLSTTLNTSLLEPPSRDIDVSAISSVMLKMRECSRTAVAIERMLSHGAPPSENAAAQLKHTVVEIRMAARQLQAKEIHSKVDFDVAPPQPAPDDELAIIAHEAAEAAHAAHRVVESKLI